MSWLLCELDAPFEVPHIDRVLSSTDPDVILPYLFGVVTSAWSDLLSAPTLEHPHQRVQLWTKYLNEFLESKDTNKPPFYLLELDKLSDPHVDAWINWQLDDGFMIPIFSLFVASERIVSISTYCGSGFGAPNTKTWRSGLCHRAHLRAPIPQLFTEALESDDEEADYSSREPAQTCSNKVFQSEISLHEGSSADKELGIMILSYLSHPGTLHDECVQLVLEALNDEDHDIRSVRNFCLFHRTRKNGEAATNLAPDAVTSGGVRETWEMIDEELWMLTKVLGKTSTRLLRPPSQKTRTKPEINRRARLPPAKGLSIASQSQALLQTAALSLHSVLSTCITALLSYRLWPKSR